MALLLLSIGNNPNKGPEAGVVEHLLRERDNSFQHVLLDDPATDVGFPLTGVPREQG